MSASEASLDQEVDETQESRLTEVVPAVEGELSEDALEELRKKAMKVMHRRKELGSALASAVQAYRLHSIATLAISRVLQEEQADPRLLLFLTHAVKAQAAEPFEREKVAQLLGEGTLPWLLDEIAQEKFRENLESNKEAQAAEEARRQEPLTLPGELLPGLMTAEGVANVQRDRTVALVGPRDAVRSRLEQIVQALAGKNVLYCRWSLDADEFPSQQGLAILPKSKWLNAAESDQQLADVFRVAMPDAPYVDALLIDDTDDVSASLSQVSIANRVSTAHRRLRRFADSLGCALILGVPTTDEQPFDLSKTGWQTLEVHTVLAHVSNADNASAIA